MELRGCQDVPQAAGKILRVNRKKKKNYNPGLLGPATRSLVVFQRAEFAQENLE